MTHGTAILARLMSVLVVLASVLVLSFCGGWGVGRVVRCGWVVVVVSFVGVVVVCREVVEGGEEVGVGCGFGVAELMRDWGWVEVGGGGGVGGAEEGGGGGCGAGLDLGAGESVREGGGGGLSQCQAATEKSVEMRGFVRCICR